MALFYGVHFIKFSPRVAWYPIKGQRELRQVFSGEAIGLLVRMGLAGVAQIASEWWSWELVGREFRYLPAGATTNSLT